MKGAVEVPYRLVAERPTQRSRFVKLVLLLSAALTLSTFLPTYLTRNGTFNHAQGPLDATVDPADGWKDDVWPLRPAMPWDISTDFPYPRKLEYDVTEGTWLRLVVHPKSGDIVFDMLGDVYCLPGSAYASDFTTRTRARPVLLGIPHDSDPHFSPDGKQLVFRSDAETGVENIWITEWTGCDNMDVRTPEARGELLRALSTQGADEDTLAAGAKETVEVKQRRLLREGRVNGASH